MIERYPWKYLIGIPARAAWRVSPDTLPPHIVEAQQFVLQKGGRTRKQLTISQKKVIDAHALLARLRDGERKRILFEGSRRESINETTTSTSDTAASTTTSNMKPVLYGPEESLASFQFRLLPTYLIVSRVLKEAISLLGRNRGPNEGTEEVSFSPQRVLDFGMGTGSSSAAALDHWPDSIEWIHGIDASETMRHGAQSFLGKLLENRASVSKVKTRLTTSAHLSSEVSLPAFDLVLFTYTATEFVHNAATISAAAILWEKLRPNGLFVMIEPGTPDGSSSVRSVRNMLLDCAPIEGIAGRDECHTVAPCTHNGPCPMDRFKNYRKNSEIENEEDTSKGYCSFVQTMAAFDNFKGEKFSYFVAQKRVCTSEPAEGVSMDSVEGELSAIRLVEELAESRNGNAKAERIENIAIQYMASATDSLGLELVKNDVSSFGRIVHAPLKRKGHILIDCCVPSGALVRHKISKRVEKDTPGLYTAARKGRWGGLWPNLDDTKTPID